MTRAEAVKLTALISQLWPSMKLGEYTADAWHLVLDDVPYQVAEDAVKAIAKTTTGYINPGAIRHQAAKAAGLLAPDEAAAYQMVNTVVGAGGHGVSQLPPAVQAAYWEMGGRFGFQGPPSVIRPQWGRVYGEVRQNLENEVLGGNLGAAIESRQRAALVAADTTEGTPT